MVGDCRWEFVFAVVTAWLAWLRDAAQVIVWMGGGEEEEGRYNKTFCSTATNLCRFVESGMTKRGPYLLFLSFWLSFSCGRGMPLHSSVPSTSSPHLEFSPESKQLVLRWSSQEADLEGEKEGGERRDKVSHIHIYITCIWGSSCLLGSRYHHSLTHQS